MKKISFLLYFLSQIFLIIKTSDPNLFRLNLFENITGARCLDGSQYGAYYSKGYNEGARNMIINIWGGGWCSGRDKSSFLSDCYTRSSTIFGSSKEWSKTVQMNGGFLGGEKKLNKNFFNWHRFDFPYCDGSGHQGHISEPVKFKNTNLYFRGNSNTLTALNFALTKVNLKNLEKLVITGCSAGGLATLYWIQYISDYVHVYNKNIKVYGLPDSGFFVDHINLSTLDHDYLLKQKVLFESVNVEVLPVSRECIRDLPGEEHKCLLAEKIFNYIKVPILMLQPGYDTWQLMNILGEDCTKNNNLVNCDDKLKEYAHQYKNEQNILIKKGMKGRKNISVWSPSCLIHCFSQKEDDSSDWEVPENSGNSINKIVSEFIEKHGGKQIDLIDEQNWPNNSKCANNVVKEIIFENKENNEDNTKNQTKNKII